MSRPFISLVRNTAIIICVGSIVSILFKMQSTSTVQYSLEFTTIAIFAPFSTISHGFRSSVSFFIGLILMSAAAIEINYDFYTGSTLKIVILWIVYIFGYMISEISSDNHKVV